MADDRMPIVLLGGPPRLPRVWWLANGTTADTRVTISHCGHHEHFERTRDVDDVEEHRAPVFRWIYTTAIAE
jgi:hypothetical protein